MHAAETGDGVQLTNPDADRLSARCGKILGGPGREAPHARAAAKKKAGRTAPKTSPAARQEAGQEAGQASGQEALGHLLQASGNGDRQAFARVYEITSPRLYPIALRFMRTREAAEDVLQEAYILIWRKAGQYDGSRGQPLSWMATIVRNRAIDRLRSVTREPRDSASWDDMLEGVADPQSARQQASAPETMAIQRCLGNLQENQRKAILLAYYYGMTHEELSARLGAPLGTVKSWIRRGLLQLKECLDA